VEGWDRIKKERKEGELRGSVRGEWNIKESRGKGGIGKVGVEDGQRREGGTKDKKRSGREGGRG